MRLLPWLFALAALAAPGCAQADLGAPCTLVRRNPDGGHSLSILEGELPLARADYVALDSTDCATACVRDADAPRTGDNALPARGYCSSSCAEEGSSAGCGKGYSCRALLLDRSALEGMCAADPARCRAFSGDYNPLFCARDP